MALNANVDKEVVQMKVLYNTDVLIGKLSNLSEYWDFTIGDYARSQEWVDEFGREWIAWSWFGDFNYL